MATVYGDPTSGSDSNGGTSWDDAYQNLDTCISNAGTNDKVWYKEGTAALSGSYPVSLKSDVDIFGGFDSALTGTNGSEAGRDLETDISILTGSDTTRVLGMADDCHLDGFTVQNGYNSADGGCWSANGMTGVQIANCIFKDHTAGDDGAVAYCGGTSTYTFTNCEFNSNTATDLGGCFVNVTSSGMTFSGCSFTGNSCGSATSSNCIDQRGNAALTVTNCTFTNNQDATGTNANDIYVDNGTFTMSGTDFICTGTADGPSVYIDDVGATATITNSTWSGYTARAITFSNNQTMSFSGCDFDDCTNTAGGGAFGTVSQTGTLSFTDCTFTNCNTSAGDGGVIASGNVHDMTFLRCVFDGNDTGTGAGDDGGCIYFSGTGTVTLTNCLMVNNHAYNDGAAICISGDNGDVVAVNCTITDNDADGRTGGICFRTSTTATLTMHNSILYGNTDVDGSPNYYQGSRTITYSDVEGGHTGTGNINVDPNFVGVGADPKDYYELDDWVSGDTPIDAGNAGASGYPSTDIKSRSRYDDTGVTNTGAGSPAYSDIGCLEKQTNSGGGPIVDHATMQLGCNV